MSQMKNLVGALAIAMACIACNNSSPNSTPVTTPTAQDGYPMPSDAPDCVSSLHFHSLAAFCDRLSNDETLSCTRGARKRYFEHRCSKYSWQDRHIQENDEKPQLQ
jgi:hypothetical protein